MERYRTYGLFVLNGLIATGVHYSILTALVHGAQLPFVGLANGVASLFGIASSFIGSRLVVFGSTQPLLPTLSRFLALYLTLAVFHLGFMLLWADFAKFAYTPGFVVATMLAMVISYLGNRHFVFPASGPGDAQL